jgi:hypothetical protein
MAKSGNCSFLAYATAYIMGEDLRFTKTVAWRCLDQAETFWYALGAFSSQGGSL